MDYRQNPIVGANMHAGQLKIPKVPEPSSEFIIASYKRHYLTDQKISISVFDRKQKVNKPCLFLHSKGLKIDIPI
jgi:hypothetical protein